MKKITIIRVNFNGASMLLVTICFVALMLVQSNNVFSAPFTRGNLVVTRVGDGSATVTAVSTAVYLDEYTPIGVLQQTIAMPTEVSGENYPFFYIGNSIYEGMINLSVDKSCLVLAGLNCAPGITIPGNTPAVIARVDVNSNINTSTIIPLTTALTNFRSVVSTNGSTFWQGGNNTGMNYTTLGTTTAAKLISPAANDNIRGMGIYDNKLYYCTNVTGKRFSVMGDATGTALPTTSSTPTTLIADASPITAPNSFVMFDLDPNVAGVDVLYITEDSGGASKGLSKYALIDGTWTFKGNITLTSGLKGIIGEATGNGIVLYAVTQYETPNKIVTITDNTGALGSLTGSFTTIATAESYKAFRGIAFAPISGPAGLHQTSNSHAAQLIYPNPAKDIIKLNLTNEADKSVTINTMSGQTIKSKSYTDYEEPTLNISDLAKGVYILKINTGKKTFTDKLVKQ